MTPLILAIESDYRQAAHLRSIIKHRVGAELVLADTTERALDAIGNRVPDLVLVPALLSPQDDAALAQALRVIASAAHVQMLTIPVLAAPAAAAALPKGGVLSALLRDRPRSASTEGCDPAVFADQIRSYLEQHARERAQLLEDLEADVALHAPAPVAQEAAPLDAVAVEPPVLEPVVDEPAELPQPAEPLPPSVFAEEPPPMAFANLLHLFEQPDPSVPAPARVEEPVVDEPVEQPAEPMMASVDGASIDELIAELTPSELPRIEEVRAETWSQIPEQPVALQEEEDEEIVLDLDQASEPEPTAAGTAASAEWVALIASLRQDMERRRTDPAPHAAPPRRRARPTQVQDEWGFFDPEQCGFAALLAKLEEITQ